MPVPSFLASIADKAQSAFQSAPLAGHPPAGHSSQRPSSPDSAAQPSANEAAAHGGHKSHALEAIQYQLRSLGQQYTASTPVQRIITTEKGVSIDFDSVSCDSKAQSKELYTWGQTETEDLKDVTDRLAYLNFVQGSLASSLSAKLDAARIPLKTLRDAETALAPRRNVRAGLQSQLARIEHDQQKGMEKKIAELKEQIKKAELDDLPQENEIQILKRKAIRESEQRKWEALCEYGEKLVLLSQASGPMIAALPSTPPTPTTPYSGAQQTGAARASLQRALDDYKTGHIKLQSHPPGAALSRSDTLSFGESHASELSSINSEQTHSNVPLTPPSSTKPLPSAPQSPGKSATPGPIDPSSLNNTPTPIPNVSSDTPATNVQAPSSPGATIANLPPAPVPTIADTGHPVVAGDQGPGPSHGSLQDMKHSSGTAAAVSVPPATESGNTAAVSKPPGTESGTAAAVVPSPHHEGAEEEKKRLAAEYSRRAASEASRPPPPAESTLPAQTSQIESVPPPAAKHETAEEEKKRLEREERERLLRAGGTTHSADDSKRDKDDDLPPYQDI